MNRMTSIGESGLHAAQQWTETVAQNMANLNTPGYRRRLPKFAPLFGEGFGRDLLTLVAKGQGVRTTEVELAQEQGLLQATGRTLDLAVEGPGFFVLQNAHGEREYTRNGVFYLDEDGRLVTADGRFVLDAAGERIRLAVQASELVMNHAGEIRQRGSEEVLARLGLVRFPNPEKLSSVGAQRYTETPASGPPVQLTPGEPGAGHILQGFTEMSNVDLAAEITDLMLAQRAFQLAARLLTEGDQLDRLASETVE